MERIGIIGMGAGCGITARMALAEMDRREEEALRRAMDMEIESLKRAEAEADAVTHDVMRVELKDGGITLTEEQLKQLQQVGSAVIQVVHQGLVVAQLMARQLEDVLGQVKEAPVVSYEAVVNKPDFMHMLDDLYLDLPRYEHGECTVSRPRKEHEKRPHMTKGRSLIRGRRGGYR